MYVGQPAGPRAKISAGRVVCSSPRIMCGAGLSDPQLAGLIQAGPKQAGPAHIAIPNIQHVFCNIK